MSTIVYLDDYEFSSYPDFSQYLMLSSKNRFSFWAFKQSGDMCIVRGNTRA